LFFSVPSTDDIAPGAAFTPDAIAQLAGFLTMWINGTWAAGTALGAAIAVCKQSI
jgi:hypothetical protein